MQTISFDILKLLKKVRNNNFVIPQFQRDFTWKEGQSKLLIDSIARGYPVGSLLLLGTDGLELQYRSIDAVTAQQRTYIDNISHSIEPTSDTYYVLDGQQRLTSIARVFLDGHPKKNYYFDLKIMYKVFFNDDEDASWIKSRKRGKTNPNRKENNRLVRSDIALDQEKCDRYITEYMEDSDDFPEISGDRTEARKASAKIRGTFEKIRKYLFTFIVLDSDAPLESVCRVFETINSTGTRLTTFDLAVARYFPEPDIKELFVSSLEKYEILSEFEIDGERILDVLSIYNLTLRGKFPEATRKEKLSLDTSFITKNWDVAAEALSIAYNWIKSQGATSKIQPLHGLVVSIATTLIFHPRLLKDSDFTQVLKKWYFCSVLARTPVPQTNRKISNDFLELKGYAEKTGEILFPEVSFTPTSLIEVKHISDKKYCAIQSLMRTTATNDLLTGLPLDSTETEDHHIFPYSLWKVSGFNRNKINSVVNRIILSKESNRTISNVNPSCYLGDIVAKHLKEGNTGDLDRRFSDSFIPYRANDKFFKKKISNDKFDNFLLNRSAMIIARIKEIVGKSWIDETK